MLKLEQISKTFYPGTADEKKVLNNCSLHVKKGEFVTIIGSNGAGKSTLFNLISGSIFPDSGRILLDGDPITYQQEYQRAGRIGHVFQDPMRGTAPSMTVEENLALACLRGRKASSPSASPRRSGPSSGNSLPSLIWALRTG